MTVYQRQIEPALEHKNNGAYEEAARYLRKTHEVMNRLGRKKEFAQYLDSVRIKHKPKRNFMKLLDQAKW